MNILLLGASGFIGKRLATQLVQLGHVVRAVGRSDPVLTGVRWVAADLARMTNENDWLPLLNGVDAVINCVGILLEPHAGAFATLHADMPCALFAACEARQVRRVIQLSAWGSDVDAETAYWRSKGKADADLLARDLDGVVLRPSLVYGEEGDSSRGMRTLATLPVLVLPMARRARVQPIHVDDLVALMLALLAAAPAQRGIVDAVGPHSCSFADYLSILRQGMRAGAGWVLPLPDSLAYTVARLAAHIPGSLLTPDTLRMLAASAGTGPLADPLPCQQLLGRPLRHPADFATPELRATAVMGWAEPILRMMMALLWLWSALTGWWWPREQSLDWLHACGIPAAWAPAALTGACLLDISLAVLLVLRPRRWLWGAQALLVVFYSVSLSVGMPEWWLHPFGALSKNLPIVLLLIMMWRMSEDKP